MVIGASGSKFDFDASQPKERRPKFLFFIKSQALRYFPFVRFHGQLITALHILMFLSLSIADE